MSGPVSLPRERISDRAARHRLLGDPTRLLIVEALTAGPRLMSELVRLAGVHRNTVRAHLARLEAVGIVERERSTPVGPGRPADRYLLRRALAPAAAEQRLLVQSLVRLVSRAYDAGAVTLAEDEGERIGRQLVPEDGAVSAKEALAGVTAILRELAFAPELSEEPGVTRIALHHCPFAVSPDDPRGGIVCAFHLGLIRGVLGASAPPGPHGVRLLPHVAPGLCRAEIHLRPAS
ncbi:MAG: helix-turn-helix domain-containing protein [Chloroflexota bacterium]